MTLHYPMSRRNFTRQLVLSPALAGAAGLIGPLSTTARAQTGTLVTINVTSQSPSPKTFFFFQQPAIYTGGATVYSNSLFNGTLPPYNPSAPAQLTFLNSLQYYAGVQTSNTAAPPVGQTSGYNSSWAAIGLQATSATNPCSTNFTQTNSPCPLRLQIPWCRRAPSESPSPPSTPTPTASTRGRRRSISPPVLSCYRISFWPIRRPIWIVSRSWSISSRPVHILRVRS
jgi:hypothetical protein